FPLPPDPSVKLAFQEGQDPPSEDPAVREAYDFAGVTYDFYLAVLRRNSLDGAGMTLRSCVHYGQRVVNAYWDGEQMLYGDGDGRRFLRFTQSLKVVSHELTHGAMR